MATKEELLQASRNRINDYEQTVNAILAFAAFVVHDGTKQRPNSQFGFGRRLTTSPNNPSPSIDITPDLVAQKSEKYGIVAEAKKSLDQNPSNWPQHVEQLRKYDDALEGWWTKNEKINEYNSVMLIHQSRGRLFRDFLEAQKNENSDSVGPNTCVVEFNESPESEPYYFFRINFGKILDHDLMDGLYTGRPIPLEEVKKSYSNIQYCDAKPPMQLLLIRLWIDYFPSKLEEGEYDDKTKSTNIQVNVSDITDELQKAFGSQAMYKDHRAGEFPKQKWIRDALDRLVHYNLAIPAEANGEYIIFFRNFRDEVLERFIKYEAQKGERKKDKPVHVQLDLKF